METDIIRRNPFLRDIIEDATIVSEVTTNESEVQEDNNPHFIESNTFSVTMDELERHCIVPTFKDMQTTISHQNFAAAVYAAARQAFPSEEFGDIEARASHQINGRTPDALHLKSSELREDQKTKFYQRFAFCFEIKTIEETIMGEPVSLTIGGVRSYQDTNLYTAKRPEKFTIFIGFRVRVCSNMMLTCDGLSKRIESMSEADIFSNSARLFSGFNAGKTLESLRSLGDTRLSISQFCQFIGRCRLYLALTPKMREELHLPSILLGDSNLNATTRELITNPNFGLKGEDDISCWQLMQLLNESAKSSYIDVWPERNQNATDIAIGIQDALLGINDRSSWFLN